MEDHSLLSESPTGDAYSQVHLAQSTPSQPGQPAKPAVAASDSSYELAHLTRLVEKMADDIAIIKRQLAGH